MRQLTAKEQKTIDEFEKARPGLGAIARQHILSPHTGWAEIIADTPIEQIVAREGTASNSFCYRRIG